MATQMDKNLCHTFRSAPLKLLRAAGKHARRRLPLLQRQLYTACGPAAPAMRSKLVETSQGVRGMSQQQLHRSEAGLCGSARA